MPRADYFATCPKGVESLLADELRALGAQGVRETRAGVAFAGALATAYRACLWSRLASRILLPLAALPAPTPEALYAAVQSLAWPEHLAPEGTLAVDLSTSASAITHAHFGALKVKDAIVDQFRAAFGTRPSIDTERPDLRVNVYLHRDLATISIDLSGESLHRRGYRREGGAAPLKENLAAAILLRAQWDALAKTGAPLVDPMCGSGTLLIEGALLAGDIAPGLLRPYFGFSGWRGHDAALWTALLEEARARRAAGLTRMPPIYGYDRDAGAVRAAKENIARAGLTQQITVQTRAIGDCQAQSGERMGLAVVNPPYGERLGEAQELVALYAQLADSFKRCLPGWRAAVLTGNPELGKHMGLRAHRLHTLYNGAVECKLLHFEIEPKWFVTERPFVPGPGAEMFANRLQKNLKHLGRWAAREGVECYRVYDADMPEYNLAIDLYQGEQRFAHVQEYEPPASVEARAAQRRLKEALAMIPRVLDVAEDAMFLKVRRRQTGRRQYEKLAQTGVFHEVHEGGHRFLVNFTDYLDTGLFLDHRKTRALIGELARGRRFLNLFAYTGTATVYAARAGAAGTTTVDMSHTYLDWARRNLALNGVRVGREHELVQADALVWLKERHRQRYDLVFLDPPTFSRSKRMQDDFDVQRDHVALLRDALALLAPGGILLFSTNNRRFKLDRAAFGDVQVEDITRRTIPKDFERNSKIHQCFCFEKKERAA